MDVQVIDVEFRKGNNGWQATSYVPLDDGCTEVHEPHEKPDTNQRMLRVSTSKGRGGITTYVGACVKSKGDGVSVVRTRVFRDYHKLAKFTQKRCTDKIVRAQHDEILAEIDWYINEAVEYEKQQQAAGN